MQRNGAVVGIVIDAEYFHRTAVDLNDLPISDLERFKVAAFHNGYLGCSRPIAGITDLASFARRRYDSLHGHSPARERLRGNDPSERSSRTAAHEFSEVHWNE